MRLHAVTMELLSVLTADTWRDITGRVIRTPRCPATPGVGSVALVWDGADDQGCLVPGGVYIVLPTKLRTTLILAR
jgi:hypothetical protein